MSKLIKWTILVVALVVPVVVFIFLKLFGKNEFQVPPLYTESLPPRPAYCGPATVPYALPGHVQARLCLSNRVPLSLLWLGLPDNVVRQRLEHAFTVSELNLIYLAEAGGDGVCRGGLSDSLRYFSDCYLFVPEQKDKILVDNDGRIRGYYGSSREETDKLILEASIILKKY